MGAVTGALSLASMLTQEDDITVKTSLYTPEGFSQSGLTPGLTSSLNEQVTEKTMEGQQGLSNAFGAMAEHSGTVMETFAAAGDAAKTQIGVWQEGTEDRRDNRENRRADRAVRKDIRNKQVRG